MVVLVTGCRSGFGLGIAVEAARRGHIVYAGLRDPGTGDALAAASAGLDVRPIALDVTDRAQIDAAVARMLAEHGRIDALVNNAGRALGGPLETIDEDELRDLLDVNVVAPWALTRAVLPAMRAQGSGTVVMISSVSGRMALPGLGAYACSKFALEGLSEAWRHELAPFGVRLFLVEPGPFRTDIWGRNRALSRRAADPDSPYASFVARLEAVVTRAAEDRAEDPAVVVRYVAELLDRPPRRLRHLLGRASALRVAARSILPDPWLAAIVQRMLAPPRGRPGVPPVGGVSSG
jgi:NAD(P)-dependent dehydrogenase (short-subunit alcohol dehydrogenase family)